MTAAALPSIIRKSMALTEAEFWRGLSALGPGRMSQIDAATARILLSQGAVYLTFTPAAPVTLGGLLALPRAEIVMRFEDAPEPVRRAFVREFDIAFQRGGG